VDCRSFGVTQILVGLHRVGVVGLQQALREVDGAGLTTRDEVVDLLLDRLTGDNFILEHQDEAYRVALWREVLRRRGEDFREFFSEVEVTVRGEPGGERDAFVGLVESVFGDFELRPVITYAEPSDEGRRLELVANGQVIGHGLQGRNSLKKAVRLSFSDW